jgi:regulator of protease activity HflC (stomatin/prohibitin superfamily)
MRKAETSPLHAKVGHLKDWKTPFIENAVRRMSMKVLQFDVQVETKTQDNVFVQIPVSIQYKVPPEGVESAFTSFQIP